LALGTFVTTFAGAIFILRAWYSLPFNQKKAAATNSIRLKSDQVLGVKRIPYFFNLARCAPRRAKNFENYRPVSHVNPEAAAFDSFQPPRATGCSV
jgi:hypothetical protein